MLALVYIWDRGKKVSLDNWMAARNSIFFSDVTYDKIKQGM